jgi:poly-gamma-glutamate synthase PgsB/CapB
MISALLKKNMSPFWQEINRRRIDQLKRTIYPKTVSKDPIIHATVVQEIASQLRAATIDLKALDDRYQSFLNRYRKASHRQKPQHLLDFARDLGSTKRQLAADRRALKRDLDDGALIDRYRRRRGELERDQRFYIERLGELCRDINPEKTIAFLHDWIMPGLNPQVRRTALQAMRKLASALPKNLRMLQFPKATLTLIGEMLEDVQTEVWLRVAALELFVLAHPQAAVAVVHEAFTEPFNGDSIFFRHRSLLILQEQDFVEGFLIAKATKDPSPHVRQGLCKILASQPSLRAYNALDALITQDPSPAVRGAALMALPQLAQASAGESSARVLLRRALQTQEGLVARVAIQVALQMATPEVDSEWMQTLSADLLDMRDRQSDQVIAHEAAQAIEMVWCRAEPKRWTAYQKLQALLVGLKPGKSRKIPRDLLGDLDETTVGRILSTLAQQDFGLDLEGSKRNLRLRRTPNFRIRLWRWWYEWRHPAPDKRQGYDHLRGRHSKAKVRAPSALMAETSATRVPGEPLNFGHEGSWRPFLPLPDDALASLDVEDRMDPVRIYTPEGIVTMKPPRGIWRKLKASMNLSFNFGRFARLRNWQEGDAFKPDAYINALRKLDFEVSIQPLEQKRAIHPRVMRFYSVAPPLVVAQLWSDFQDYFGSIYDNSLRDLAIISGTAISAFLLRSLWLYRSLRLARKRIPLVIGGWGTRGKSGTERLKAALFNGLGLRMMSKTTGCEARFLYSQEGTAQQDIPIFRPMGKATIWEQGHLLKLADKMDTEVVLWECMALNPTFVHILQRDWMRDDLSTITNTHPDHEDLQGPSGYDVAQTIGRFVPANGKLITTEEHMLPILKSQAERSETEITAVGWLQAGLLPEDLLERFPYDEHPYNIALVTQMAESLGIEPDLALKEMADRVVPDLGVLKTFGAVSIAGRQLSFVNGMSANERLGCLTNWNRLGFDDLTLDKHPEAQITLLVNNRVDRIARSRVFAEIIVRDLKCDQIAIVGTNVEGMERYLMQSWEKYLDEQDLHDPQVFTRLAQQLRIPTRQAYIETRKQVMCQTEVSAAQDSNEPPVRKHHLTAIKPFLEQDQKDLDTYLHWHAHMQQHARCKSLQVDLRQQLTQWFTRKIQVFQENQSSDQVLDQIVGHTPNGMHNHIMGIQNIKGPGIDMIRQFQKWEATQHLMQRVQAGETNWQQLLSDLDQLFPVNNLTKHMLGEILDHLSTKQLSRNHQQHVEQLGDKLFSKHGQQEKGSAKAWKPIQWLCTLMEPLLEAGEAVRRRRQADQIYRDLGTMRISFSKAADQLQQLEKQQQPGWLWRKWQK